MEGLVGMLKGGKLRRLDVYLDTGDAPESGGVRHAYSVDAFRRKRDGTRSRKDQRREILWAKTEERILGPLGELRGVKHVAVSGTVTDEWVVWLENAIRSDGETVLEFVRPEVGGGNK